MPKEPAALALTAAVTKGLNDKLYEKRKNAALEVERCPPIRARSLLPSSSLRECRIVKDLCAGGEVREKEVNAVITSLRDEFVYSPQPNSRKGGLIGLAAAAIALGQHLPSVKEFLALLVPPVIACFDDTDTRVRYYTCEALYNISKVARGDILTFFNRIFAGLAKLVHIPAPAPCPPGAHPRPHPPHRPRMAIQA